MFKNKLLSAAGLSAALALSAGTAYAAPYLIPTGTAAPDQDYVQLMEDNDWEVLIRENPTTGEYELVDVTPTTQIQDGDLFAGVLQIQTTELVPPLGGGDAINLQGDAETFTALFLIETTSVTSPNGNVATQDNSFDIMQFGTAGTAAWEDVYGTGGLIDVSSGFDITDLDAGTAGAQQVDANTMALLFNGDVYNTQDAGDPLTLSQSATTFVDGGTLQYEFGFTGEPGATEFWTTTGTDAALPALSGTTLPTNKLSLNVTQQWAGPELDEHNYRGTSGGDAAFTGPAQLQGQGSVTGLAADSPWAITTDTDFWIRPVPSPAPLAMLALGLVGLGMAKRWKKSA